MYLFPLFRLVSGNLGRWVWAHTLRVYKVFTKTGWGSLAKRRLCLGPASVINYTPLSASSFWVSLFPRTCDYNILTLLLLMFFICHWCGSSSTILFIHIFFNLLQFDIFFWSINMYNSLIVKPKPFFLDLNLFFMYMYFKSYVY